tara:strand:+ start:125 stop:316 length:192 start_codon:yes stop_codon:yes gene_type:complete
MKLSDQAMGAIMMALQKSLMEQSDITPVLKGMEFDLMDNGELLVKNPPTVKAKPKIYTGSEDA